MINEKVCPSIRAVQSASLRTLTESGVTLAIGSDNLRDSSVLEAEHLHSRSAGATIRVRRCLVPEPLRRSAACQRRVIQTSRLSDGPCPVKRVALRRC